ncbi:MAG TPA: ABC transporter ATP-binding protein [Chlamydiales bacterium]|nr:ABC transporter ATP-binding protein [Chlamydiales bacterium]
MPFLQAENLSKIYYKPTKQTLLNQINLTVHRNESIAIMGASGEGKTTLLHILGGLEKPTDGQVIFKEHHFDTKHPQPAFFLNKSVGFVFQSSNLFEDLTVIENILLPAKIARRKTHKKSESYKQALQLLSLIGLQDKIEAPAKILSGGEKQRVAIARAFCNDPQIILADEPSGNLDFENSLLIHSLLIDCVKKFNKSLIVVTHDIELAKLCNKIYTLKSGHLTIKTS